MSGFTHWSLPLQGRPAAVTRGAPEIGDSSGNKDAAQPDFPPNEELRETCSAVFFFLWNL
jgi:hypothetical protein